MSTTTSLRSRVEPSGLSVGLAAGDALALATFVLAGTAQHGEQPLRNPGAVAEALVPFLLGWVTVAVLAGLYTADAVASPRQALVRTLPAWLGAVALSHGLRATALFEGGTAWSFVAVTLVVGGVLVVGWRLVAAAVTGPVGRQ